MALDSPSTLIIRPSALGDTLLLAPALYHMADTVSASLLGRRPGIDFLKPLLKKCLDYEKGGWHTLFFDNPLCENLPFPDVDRIICFLTDPSGTLHKGLKKCLKHTPIFSFPPFPQGQDNIHVAAYLAACLEKSGLSITPEKALHYAQTRPLLGKPKLSVSDCTIVVHPGSGSKKKNYSPEFWLNLINNKDLGIAHTWIVLLGPAEVKWNHITAQKPSDRKIEIIYSPHKDELVSLLEKASLYIGHDSGITHLAAMLGTHTICLFKNSDPFQWAPLGPNVTVIPYDMPLEHIYKKIVEELARI